MSTAPEPISFAALTALVRASVEAVAATEPDPGRSVPRPLPLRRGRRAARARGRGRRRSRRPPRHGRGAPGPEPARGLRCSALCAAPELHPRYGRLYGYLHDDLTRRLREPAADRAPARGRRLSRRPDVLACFDRTARLRASGALRISERRRLGAARRARRAGRRPARRLPARRRPGRRARATGASRSCAPTPTCSGARPCVAELAAMLAARDAGAAARGRARRPGRRGRRGRPAARARRRRRRGRPRAAARGGADRGARGAACVALGGVEQLEPAPARALQRWLASREERVDPLRAHGRRRVHARPISPTIIVEVPEPSLRRAAHGLGGAPRAPTTSTTWRPSSGSRSARSSEAAEVAKVVAAAAGRDARGPPTSTSARAAPRAARSAQLATRLDLRFGWDDLILPTRSAEVLRSISAYIRHRDLVLSDWGYERTVATNQGVKTLFAGDSGTGKTMAAQVLARDLGLEIFRLDLATVVSKYIGETEKNLDRIFAAADGSNAILFFDEADALFGKRSDVQDAHDRYANLEVAYLLQRMESYAGRRRPGHELPPEHRRGVPAPARLRGRLPVPGGRRPRAHLAAAAAAAGAARRRRRPRLPGPPVQARRAATSATPRWPRRSWPPRTAA